jgi:hypothetical protein
VPDGAPMDEQHWNEAIARAIGLFLAGDDLGVDQRGQRITDSTFYVMLNGAVDPVEFVVPGPDWGNHWRTLLDTRSPDPPRLAPAATVTAALPEAALSNFADTGTNESSEDGQHRVAAGARLELVGHSIVVLERVS